MNLRAAIEMQKIVAWTLGVLVLLAIMIFMVNQLAPGTEGSATQSFLDRLLNAKP